MTAARKSPSSLPTTLDHARTCRRNYREISFCHSGPNENIIILREVALVFFPVGVCKNREFAHTYLCFYKTSYKAYTTAAAASLTSAAFTAASLALLEGTDEGASSLRFVLAILLGVLDVRC